MYVAAGGGFGACGTGRQHLRPSATAPDAVEPPPDSDNAHHDSPTAEDARPACRIGAGPELEPLWLPRGSDGSARSHAWGVLAAEVQWKRKQWAHRGKSWGIETHS